MAFWQTGRPRCGPGELLAGGQVAQAHGDRSLYLGGIELGQVDGCRVETFQQDFVLALGTVVAQVEATRQVLVLVVFVLVGLVEQEGALVKVVLGLFVVALVYDYAFVFFVFVDNIKFIDFDFRFFLGVVGLCRHYCRQCQQCKKQGNTSYIFHLY